MYRKINSHLPTVAPNGKPWNIVVVMLESFAHYKTGLSGNPLHASPNLERLSKEGIYFSNTFSAYENTARGIWTVLTANPDTATKDMSTRNPQTANQELLINQLTNYQKYFFMGGDPRFANIKALLSNIKELQMFDMFSNSEQILGAWGVPDHLIMDNAHEQFSKISKLGKPFVAVILTGSHHEPHLIPSEIIPKLAIPKDIDSWSSSKFSQLGFSSKKELSSFIYTDYSIGKFIEKAKNEEYFANTIFAFIADHGVYTNVGEYAEDKLRNSELKFSNRYIPWVIYAPALAKYQQIKYPNKIDYVVSQMDVFPTLLSLAGVSYWHSTLGRNVLDKQYKPTAFTFTPNQRAEIGWMNNQYYYLGWSSNTSEIKYMADDKLFNLQGEIKNVGVNNQEILLDFKTKANAFYKLSHYLLTNNK